jgi:geranyl-CoA carboxylase beta subunit
MASDSAIKGGTIPPMGLKKSLRAQEIARDNKLPLIYLVESGGANLIYQAEIFIEGGRSFANQARLSAAGIPQIAVVHGASTAGGAYLPGLSDYVILVRGRSSIYLAGPPLVKAAIGEDATDEEALGGAEMHAVSPAWASTCARTTPTPSPLARE